MRKRLKNGSDGKRLIVAQLRRHFCSLRSAKIHDYRIQSATQEEIRNHIYILIAVNNIRALSRDNTSLLCLEFQPRNEHEAT